MRTSIGCLTAVLAALVGQIAGQNAEPVTDNPVGVTYKATLPDTPFFKYSGLEGNVKGYISATANRDGNGVDFSVLFSNLPKEGGPFREFATLEDNWEYREHLLTVSSLSYSCRPGSRRWQLHSNSRTS